MSAINSRENYFSQMRTTAHKKILWAFFVLFFACDSSLSVLSLEAAHQHGIFYFNHADIFKMTTGLTTTAANGTPPKSEKLIEKQSPTKKQAALRAQIVSLDPTEDFLNQPGMKPIVDEFLEHHRQCITSARNALLHALACGKSLAVIRTAYGHSKWTSGYKRDLEQTLGVGLRMAERYIKVFGEFQAFAIKNNLSGVPENDSFYLSLIENFKATQDEEKQSLTTDPNDWTTPEAIVAAVQRLVGKVDIDPCGLLGTDLLAYGENEKTYYATDFAGVGGLSPDATWNGRAWIAPGHSGDLSGWTNKAIEQHRAGVMTTGLMMLPVEVIFSQPHLFEFPVAVLSPLTVQTRRLKKLKDGSVATVWKPRVMSQVFGVCLISHEHTVAEFATAFRDIGVVFSKATATEQALPKRLAISAGATAPVKALS